MLARRLVILFFLSGATGLVYEVLWTRRLTLVFGHSVLAVSTVLAAFMAGLGVGSLLGGRWADRIQESRVLVLVYSRLEFGVAASALASWPLLAVTQTAYLWLARAGVPGLALEVACLLMSCLVLLPPTLLMGATLPVIVRGLDESEPVGRLYGANTLGACTGAALAGYLLLPGLGSALTLLVTAAVNLALGRGAQVLSRDWPSTRIAGADSSGAAPAQVLLALAVGLSGAAGMTLQVGWTRGLVLTLGSTTYTLAAILTLYLAGLGLGSWAYSRWPPVPRTNLLAAFLLAASVLGAVSLVAVGFLPYLVWTASPDGLVETLALQLALCALILLGPAVLLGLIFPLAVNLYQSGRADRLGQRVGRLYAASTAGAVLGAVASGFLVLPMLGAQWSLKIGCLLLLLACLLVGLQAERLARRTTWLALVGVCGLLVVLVPGWNPALMSAGISIYARDYERLPGLGNLARISGPAWYRDGASSTVSVHFNADGLLTLRINGKADASTSLADLSTMYLTGYLPSLWTRPRKAAVIGLGGGMTLQALASVPGVEQVDCAELEPAVVEAQSFWKGFNGRVADDPRVHLHVADGRTFIASRSEKYDVIVSEPSNVWMAGVGNLFSLEFYLQCRARLAEGGVMAQWFQNYGVSDEEVGTVIHTFFEAFPAGSVWLTSTGEGDLLLLGSVQPLKLDPDWMQQLTSTREVRRHLFDLGLCQSEAVLGTYLCDRAAALDVFSHSPVNTDDRNLLEFQAARYLLSGIHTPVTPLTPRLMGGPPLPADLALEPRQDAVLLGWLATRNQSELQTLLKAYFPKNSPTALSLALLATLDRRLNSAGLAAAFRPAVQGPSSPLACYLLAGQLRARQDWKDSAHWFLKACQNPPSGGECSAWQGLGVCRFQMDQLLDAAQAFEKAVRLGGGAEALTFMADAYLHQRQPERALSLYSQAVSLNPVYVPAQWGRAQALLVQDRYDLAADGFLEVTRLVPGHELALTNLAYCQIQLHDLSGARRTYNRLLRYYPNSRLARANLRFLEDAGPNLSHLTPVGEE